MDLPGSVSCAVFGSPAEEIGRTFARLGLRAEEISAGWHRFGGPEPVPLPPQEPAAFRVVLPLGDNGRPVVPEELGGWETRLDLPIRFTPDHWCPSAAAGRHFATSALAGERIGVPALRVAGATGEGVNVVVVDHGVDPAQLPPGSSFGRHWVRLVPGQPPQQTATPPPLSRAELRHGTMIARTVLSIAPKATIWDLRVVPRPGEVISRLLDVKLGYSVALQDIACTPALDCAPWVFVNPWGIYDGRYDMLQEYVDKQSHWFTAFIGGVPNGGTYAGGVAERRDLVFAAGNAGQFCPSWRQGPNDRGPGRSILGVNGHPRVLSVGAVRADHIWIGYSSQGRSRLRSPQSLQGFEKPDLCAPSSFLEQADRARLNSGTSAASAVAAGVIAALRSYERINMKPPKTPAELAGILRDTARPPPVTAWSERRGRGVIDAAAALARL